MMLELKELLNKVICGDCLSVMRGLPDGSIKLIYIDPPFGFK
jgi:DNA modification methylase